MKMKEKSKTTNKRVQHWEIWVTINVIIFTLIIGWFWGGIFKNINPAFINSLIIALLELAIGTVIYLFRKNSIENELLESRLNSFHDGLAESCNFCKDSSDLHDSEIENSIVKIVSNLAKEKDNPILFKIVKNYLNEVDQKISEMCASSKFSITNRYELNNIQRRLHEHLGLLPNGSKYLTVSNLRFWSGHEISNPSAFLSYNLRLAEYKNIKFERIFLLDRPFSELDKDQDIVLLLKNHLEFTKRSKNMVTYVIEDDKTKIISPEKYGNFSIWFSNDSKPYLLYRMIYFEDSGKFDKMEIDKDIRKIEEYHGRFKDLLEKSKKIEDFFKK